MQLPLDFKTLHRPVKAKYIDEETPGLERWVLGFDRADGLKDVYSAAGGCEDVMVNVPSELAARLVEARNDWVELNLSIINGRA